MTTGVTDVTAVGSGSPPPAHPLDPLTADELRCSRRVLDAAGLLRSGTRFALVQLLEPAKDDVLSWVPGAAIDRRVFSVLLDTDSGAVSEVVVSLDRERVLHSTIVPTTTHPTGSRVSSSASW